MSALDEGRLAEVEAAAMAATPGPWGKAAVDGQGFAVHRGEHDTIALYADRDNAAHIAAASPDVVLALVAEVREARAMRDRVRRALDGWTPDGRLLSADERGRTYEKRIRDALRGPVAASGSQNEPVDPSGPNGVQIATQSREPITTADLADAAGRASRAAQERLEGGR